MRSLSRLALLGPALLGLLGCIVPRPLVTRTEVVGPGDSTPLFGQEVKVLLFDKGISLVWDERTRTYAVQAPQDLVDTRGIRVARLKGDVYLFQVARVEERYALVPARISRTREVTPLACSIPEEAAADFGIRTTIVEDLFLDLRGDRSGILGLLTGILKTCNPLLRVDTLVPSGRELATDAATPGRDDAGACSSCPSGGCVQGTVMDNLGGVLPGVAVKLEPQSPDGAALTAKSDDNGAFFFAAIPQASYRLRLELAGFINIVSGPAFYVKTGVTSVFDTPFVLQVGPVEETITLKREPLRCRGRAH
jgi:Carboxypeptidase regulatory-like domain